MQLQKPDRKHTHARRHARSSEVTIATVITTPDPGLEKFVAHTVPGDGPFDSPFLGLESRIWFKFYILKFILISILNFSNPVS